MMTDSDKAQRGSDWIDIIWAAYENALINAELYYALGYGRGRKRRWVIRPSGNVS